MFSGQVISIHIAGEKGAACESMNSVQAVAGQGLAGDRNLRQPGDAAPHRQITLIEIEALEALAREEGLELAPGESRRNLVTRGVPLNHLVGRVFRAGEARLRGVKLCEPCEHLERITGMPVRAGLVHRGGLRAEILTGGLIRAGDPVVPEQ